MIGEPREQLGGNTGATIERAKLGMLDHGFEAVLGGRGVAAGLPAEMNDDGSPGGRILSSIGPSLGRAVARHFARFEDNRRIIGAIQTLRPFWTEAQIPRAIATDQ